ncbi:MAG: MIP/aquaporin family protein [Flavobacteriaceae bacterium]
MNTLVAEFFGTYLMMLLGLGVNANVSLKNTKGSFSSASAWVLICAGWAFAVYVGVVVAGPISGAHLNPAVSLALLINGSLTINEFVSYVGVQFAGAIAASFSVWFMYNDHFKATESLETRRGVFCTAPEYANVAQNFFSEFIGAFVLLFAILHFTDPELMASGEKIGMGSIGALPVAIVVWGIGLSLGGTTGYAINPARDLGPRIAHALLPVKEKADGNWSYSWIPVVGPLCGAAFAALLFSLLS